ncbi:sugar transferase [Jiella sp. M17.18]
MTRFPGIRAAGYVMPCFAATYGFVLVAFFIFRLDYARSLFVLSFAICIVWFFAGMASARQTARPAFAVVPIGDVRRLLSLPAREIVVLEEPAPPRSPVDGLVADFRADLPPAWESFIADWVLQGRPAYHVKHAAEMLTGRVEIEHLSENSFGSLDPGGGYRKVKAVVDVLAAAALMPFFLVLAAVVGIAIRLDSKGPVFFRQQRVGYRGRVFTVFKFRTMIDGKTMAEQASPDGARTAAMTTNADPRITRLGRLLRRSRIDEIPQLLNVLRGEMSWIGPRPEALPLSRWYEGELPFYRYRHVVRPGITGWAQVNQGHVVEMHDVLGKLHYDFYYIKYFSPWLDMFISLRTIWIMMRGRGAR